MKRDTFRQALCEGVGLRGQAAIGSTVAAVRGQGHGGMVALRYAQGAGFAAVEQQEGGYVFEGSAIVLDPAAGEVLEAARDVVRQIVAALEVQRS